MIAVFRIAIGCVVLALLVSSNVGGARVFASADTNADQAIDVRDVQLVGAALLSHARPGDAADVNGDGRVDVLDFQQVVNEAAKAGSGNMPAFPGDSPRQAPSAPSHELIALKAAASAAVAMPVYAVAARPDRAAEFFAPQHARLERLGLAANAPPVA